jgi:hypothetical protein
MDAGEANTMKFFAGHTINLRHGHTRHHQISPEYNTWTAIKSRCLNSNSHMFIRYGAKGVTVCSQWLNSFETFLNDMGPRPSAKHSIDRFPDRHGNYEPGNVRWATKREQSLNRDMTYFIELNGVTRPLMDVCVERGINAKAMYGRLRLGWSYQRIISTPINKKYWNRRAK